MKLTVTGASDKCGELVKKDDKRTIKAGDPAEIVHATSAVSDTNDTAISDAVGQSTVLARAEAPQKQSIKLPTQETEQRRRGTSLLETQTHGIEEEATQTQSKTTNFTPTPLLEQSGRRQQQQERRRERQQQQQERRQQQQEERRQQQEERRQQRQQQQEERRQQQEERRQQRQQQQQERRQQQQEERRQQQEERRQQRQQQQEERRQQQDRRRQRQQRHETET